MPSFVPAPLFLGISLLARPAFAEKAALPSCPSGEHRVRAHARRAYVRANGTIVAASKVPTHCHPNPTSFATWHDKLRPGKPANWRSPKEKSRLWTAEEVERVLEALASLPDELLAARVNGIFRLGRSRIYGSNPGGGSDENVVLYDLAFEPSQNLARIIAHEFAHKLYRQFTDDEARSYNQAADWIVVPTPSGRTVFAPMREVYVEEDGREGPDEDFSNNIEYYLFAPDRLKTVSPKVYDWIRQRYRDKFKLREGAR